MKLKFHEWTRLQLLIALCAVVDAWVFSSAFDAGTFARKWGFKDSRHLRAVLKCLARFPALHQFDGVDKKNRHHVYYCAESKRMIEFYERGLR